MRNMPHQVGKQTRNQCDNLNPPLSTVKSSWQNEDITWPCSIFEKDLEPAAIALSEVEPSTKTRRMLFSPFSFCLASLTILATTTLACGPLSAPSGSSFCATQSCKLTIIYIFFATAAVWLHISRALCWKKLVPIAVANLTVFMVITTSLLPHQHWGKLEVEGFLEEGGQEQSSTTGCCSCSERWPSPRGSLRASVEQLCLPADWQPGQ